MPPDIPAVVNPSVPAVVIGDPVTPKRLAAGTERPTLVTEPPPAPAHPAMPESTRFPLPSASMQWPLTNAPEIVARTLCAGCVALGVPSVAIWLIHSCGTAAKLLMPPSVVEVGAGRSEPTRLRKHGFAARPPTGPASTVAGDCVLRTAGSVPDDVTGADGVEEKTQPSPVNVTLVTVPKTSPGCTKAVELANGELLSTTGMRSVAASGSGACGTLRMKSAKDWLCADAALDDRPSSKAALRSRLNMLVRLMRKSPGTAAAHRSRRAQYL